MILSLTEPAFEDELWILSFIYAAIAWVCQWAFNVTASIRIERGIMPRDILRKNFWTRSSCQSFCSRKTLLPPHGPSKLSALLPCCYCSRSTTLLDSSSQACRSQTSSWQSLECCWSGSPQRSDRSRQSFCIPSFLFYLRMHLDQSTKSR